MSMLETLRKIGHTVFVHGPTILTNVKLCQPPVGTIRGFTLSWSCLQAEYSINVRTR